MSYRITILGTGYVGLVCGVGLADFGNRVVCTDVDGDKIDLLKKGIIPIYEPGIGEYFERNCKEGRLCFEKDVALAIKEGDVVFIVVGTPSRKDGEVDLSFLWNAVEAIATYSTTPKTVVVKSTVPVGTTRKVERKLKELNPDVPFTVVFNPEFLREGKAVYDFFHPDKVVIGTKDREAQELMQEIYRPLYLLGTPFVFCNFETAELIKYANNAFLALKITFINQIANLCDAVGADVQVVAKALGMDGRIGPKFLHPGPGFGGSCFPKDIRALVKMGKRFGEEISLIEEVIKANERQRKKVVEKLEKLLGDLEGRKICVLGLAFKAETDDIRESPAIDVVRILLERRAKIHAHDPQAIENARSVFENSVSFFEDMYEAMKDSDAICILTEWNCYRNLDLEKVRSFLKGNVILDARNVLEPDRVKQKGFVYEGMGRR
ncbi:UDP-glucose dehydrogenase family protein [Atrimonas thermophila]|uniref:UDP-glucose dehydrogenase family protein n=1 Tax=Atrimonas thermophila TaxID=3064161 RepID=UPI00399C78DF